MSQDKPSPALSNPAPKFETDDGGDYFRRGVELHKKGELEKALVEFEKAASVTPDNDAAHLNCGIILGALGKNDEALREFKKAIETNPDNGAAYFNRGVILMRKEQWKEAATSLEKALFMGERTAALHYNLAICYEYSNGVRYGREFAADKCIQHYTKVIQRSGENSVVLYNMGVVYFKTGAIANAEGAFRRSTEIDPHMADAFYQLGLVNLKGENYHSALKNLHEAQRLEPRLPVGKALGEAHEGLGRFYMENGDFESAKRNLEAAVSLDPSRPRNYILLGRTHRHLKNYTAAIDDLNRARSIDGALPLARELAELQALRGDEFLNEGNLQLAVAQYEQAIQLDPECGLYYAKLGSVYLGPLKSPGKAIFYYRKALGSKLSPLEAERIKGEFAAAMRDGDDLLPRYRALVNRNPDNATLRYNLALLLQQQGKLDEAVDEYNKVLQHAPENSYAAFNLGMTYQQKGVRSAALKAYQRALSMSPRYSRARLALGKLYEDLGANDKAREEYEKITTDEPDYAEAYRALGEIFRDKLSDSKKAEEYFAKYKDLNRPEAKESAPAIMP